MQCVLDVDCAFHLIYGTLCDEVIYGTCHKVEAHDMYLHEAWLCEIKFGITCGCPTCFTCTMWSCQVNICLP